MADLIWTGRDWQAPVAGWPLADRALHYGDGLFETVRFDADGQLPLWHWHRQRLLRGLVQLDFPVDSLAQVDMAMAALPASARQGAGKLLLSRGCGPRGYAVPEPVQLQLLWQSFTAPEWAIRRFPQGFQTAVSEVQLSQQPLLAGIKHLNRLEQVLIRQTMPPGCQEVVVTDTQQRVVEGCMSNLFLVRDGRLLTPSLHLNGVNGVIRQWLQAQHDVTVAELSLNDVVQADELFFCNTLNGIIPVRTLADRTFSESSEGWQRILSLQHSLEALFC